MTTKSLRNFRIVLWVLVAAVAIGATALYLFRPPARPLGVTGQSFALASTKGGDFTQASLKGTPSLIFFGYTFCPDVCPTTLALMGAALDRLGPDQDRIVPVFITIDPERDTPEVLKKYVAAFGPRLVGLTGTPDEIAKVEKEYRVYAKKGPIENGTYAMDHSSVIYLMGPDGKLVSFYDEAVTPEDLAQKIKAKL